MHQAAPTSDFGVSAPYYDHVFGTALSRSTRSAGNSAASGIVGHGMHDLFGKCRDYSRVREMIAEGACPYGQPIEERHGTEVTVEDRRVIMGGSNDYLGLSTDPRVIAAAIEATKRYGASCTGSRVLNGTLTLHLELEARLARFLGREAAVVAPTGFQTNLALAALLGRDDAVFADMANHASLVDAARLGFAQHWRYRHGDMVHLERLLAASEPDGGRLIATDGLFSMAGDVCDLRGIGKLAQRYHTRVAVDCSHDLGPMGAHGRGAPEYHGLEDRVDVVTATFSKCFGSVGGVVASDDEVIHSIRHVARSLVFSAALPPSSTGAALAALDIIETEPERRRVFEFSDRLRAGFRAIGLRTAGETPIVPVFVNEDRLCRRYWKELLTEGVFTNAVVAPGVPAGQEPIRVSVTANHTERQVDRIVEAFAAAGRTLGVVS
jgi:8-amino-7-oxononanoate synthase